MTTRECIPLPAGSELFLLPGRLPVGFLPNGEREVLDEDPLHPGRKVTAVAAFLAPAHTVTRHAAYATQPGAPALPLFAYCAVGFYREEFVVTALRSDPLPRQDPDRFPAAARIAAQAQRLERTLHGNRLARQLAICASTYCCPAARNFALGRWEAPLPTSPACNAACFGCLNSQPEGRFPCTQSRITESPSPAEVAQVALYHLEKARDPLVSYGQGCEGEPLMVGELLEESIRLIRAKAPRGTVNLNTNGSRPEVVRRLFLAGLSSLRVSLNSVVPERHAAYYRPRGWSLDDAAASLKAAKSLGGFASINLLCLPGITDREDEAAALVKLVEETGLDLIQWRNLNLDPEAYLECLGPLPPSPLLGIRGLMTSLRRRFPHLKHGYFNPKLC